MRGTKLVTVLFLAAAAYDGILGAAFLVAPGLPFRAFDVTPPNHSGYVQFPALLLLIFSWMFLRVAMDPVANRSLIPYGMALKVSYCGVVFGYWFTTGIPGMWKPFALADLLFLLCFGWAWVRLGAPAERSAL